MLDSNCYDLELFGPISSINYLQFWQYTVDKGSLYIDGLRIRKQTSMSFDPQSYIGDMITLLPARSYILSINLIPICLFGLFVVLVIVKYRHKKTNFNEKNIAICNF